MALRFSHLTVLTTLAILLAVVVMGSCSEPPTASDNEEEGCDVNEEYDPEQDECVFITAPQPDNQGNDPADDLEPWDDESGDGVPNRYDNCPFHYNPDQIDTSGDGVGDVCDNCPDHANPDQAFSPDNPVDDRGVIMGDACSPVGEYVDTFTDSSNDGVPDVMDLCPDHYNPPLETGCECPPGDVYCTQCLCQCPDDIYPCDGCAQLDSSGDGTGDACDNCPDHYNPNQTSHSGNPTDSRGIVMGDACAPVPNNIPICAEQSETFEVIDIDPNVYISLDLSGSMAELVPATGNSRMQEAKMGLDQIAQQLHGNIRFGLGTYPHPTQGMCTISHVLDIGHYSMSELQNTWSGYHPIGMTPMFASLDDIRQHNRLHDPSDPHDNQREKAVLLITDGVANCSSGNSQQNVVNVISDLYSDGILTFVVGFNIDDPSLQAYADAGGTDEYYLANEADELADAITEVTDLLIGCRYELQPPPEDPNKIWLSVDGHYLPMGDSHYDESENTLVLDSDACDELRNLPGDNITVDIEMGCVSECVPEEPRGKCDRWYETCGREIYCLDCSPEICDGRDNDCSGTVDDNCTCSAYLHPCETTEDCCEPLHCSEEGVCDRECYPAGAPCRSHDDCCATCDAVGGEVGECLEG